MIQTKCPIIPLQINDTGKWEFSTDLVNPTLTTLLYLVTLSGDRYVPSGSDLKSDDNLSVTYSNQKIVVEFDPSQVAGVTHGNLYGVTILCNSANNVTVTQRAYIVIFKIRELVS